MKWLILLLIAPLTALALTVQDVTISARVVGGNWVSDRIPTITLNWVAPTTDTDGNPLTITRYELRYKSTVDQVYSVVVLPADAVSYEMSGLSSGSYTGILEVVDAQGTFSTAAQFNWSAN
jgi:hypothetical protein